MVAIGPRRALAAIAVLGLAVVLAIAAAVLVARRGYDGFSFHVDAPAAPRVGEPIVLDVWGDGAHDLAGFELTATVDPEMAEIDGVDTRPGALAQAAGYRELAADQLPGRAVLGGYTCASATCGPDAGAAGAGGPVGVDGTVLLGRIHLRALEPGAFDVRVGRAQFLDGAGRAIASARTEQLLRLAPASDPAAAPSNAAAVAAVPAPELAPTTSAPPASSTSIAPATTALAALDGRPALEVTDLTELALEWQLAARVGGPCGAAVPVDPSDAVVGDLDGDGCLRAGDLQVAASAIAGTAPAPGPSAVPATAATTVDPGLAATGGTDVDPTVLVVTDTTDGADMKVGDGKCVDPAGGCSLRAAIIEANAIAGPNTIRFAIPGPAPHHIQLTKRLTTISDLSGGLTIDGYSQPGSAPNTDPVVSNAVITIEIEGIGSANATDFDGFAITSADNVFKGLAVYDLMRPFWAYGPNATRNAWYGNFVGTNAAGTYAAAALSPYSAYGIDIEQNAPAQVVGSPAAADRNVISGNARHGLAIYHDASDGTVVYNNIIGLSPNGTARLANRKQGVDINFGVSGTIVGGTGAGQRNVISGNFETGIEISHQTNTQDNVVRGNYIGTDVTGTRAFSWTANNASGVYIEDGAATNLVESNIIGNNTQGGVQVVNGGTHGVSLGNVVRNNSIGVSLDGTPIPNGRQGVQVNGSSTTIGPGNLIAYNAGPGVKVAETDAVANRITANAIWGNSGLGIDLAPLGLVNANDAGDADEGANHLLNFPEPSRVTTNVFQGSTCGGCLVEVFVVSGTGANGSGFSIVTAGFADAAGAFDLPNPGTPAGTVVTMTATDALGDTSEFSTNTTVVVHNDAPVLSAPPGTVPEGGSTTLTASATDPDGDTITYAWDLDGNGSFEAPGRTVTFSAAALDGPSTSSVKVRATDARGLSTTAFVAVDITNVAPAATVVAPAGASEGASVVVGLTGAADPGPTDTALGLHYAFDCGAGFPASTAWADTGPVANATCGAPDGPGTAPFRARVIDRDDGVTELAIPVPIANVAPAVAITGAPASAAEGDTLTLGTTVTDPSAADLAAGPTIAWTATRAGATLAEGAGPALTLPLRDDGPVTVAVTATDRDGGVGTSAITVPVANVAPTATLQSAVDVSGAVHATITFADEADPGADDLAAGLHHALACDNSSLASATYASASASATLTCTYTDGLVGHQVRARVIDEDGGFTEYSTTVTSGSNQPPSATVAPSFTVAEQGTVTLTASGSDPEGGALTYAWDLDADGTFEAVGASVAFDAAGIDGPATRDVAVAVTDAAGLTAGASTVVHVTNAPPTGALAPIAAVEGAPATVTVTGAGDPSPDDTAGLRYAFSCSGSSLAAASWAAASPSPTTVCTWPDGPATATVRAAILDDDGAVTELSATATVANAAPVVTVDPVPAASTEGASVSFTSSASDPGPIDESAGVGSSWRVRLGTQTVATGAGLAGSFVAADDGTYTVEVTAADKDGGTTTASADVAVAGVAPTATLVAPATVTEGAPFTVSMTSPVEPSGTDLAAGLRYAFSCDGASLAFTTWASSSPSSTTTCTIPDQGSVTVRARIYDEDGLFTFASSTVTATSVAPTATVLTPADVAADEPIPLSVTGATDPAAADVAAGFTYALDCGGGYGGWSSTAATTCAAGTGPGGAALRTLRAKVRDKDGAEREYPAAVVVHANLLANGGFETADGAGKPVPWLTTSSSLARATGTAHGGAAALRYAPAGSGSVALSQTAGGVVPRTRYLASVWVNIPAGPAGSSGSVTPRLRWKDANGTLVSTSTLPVVSQGTAGWVLVSRSVEAAAGATQVTVELTVAASAATVWVDDVTFRRDNQLLNPGFEVDDDADGRPDLWWLWSRFTRSSSTLRLGASAARSQGDGTAFAPGQTIKTDVLAGQPYHVAVWVDVPPTADPVVVRIRARWLGTTSNTIRLDTIGTVTGATPGWVQVVGTVTPPAGSNQVALEIYETGLTTELYTDDAYVGPA